MTISNMTWMFSALAIIVTAGGIQTALAQNESLGELSQQGTNAKGTALGRAIEDYMAPLDKALMDIRMERISRIIPELVNPCLDNGFAELSGQRSQCNGVISTIAVVCEIKAVKQKISACENPGINQYLTEQGISVPESHVDDELLAMFDFIRAGEAVLEQRGVETESKFQSETQKMTDAMTKGIAACLDENILSKEPELRNTCDNHMSFMSVACETGVLEHSAVGCQSQKAGIDQYLTERGITDPRAHLRNIEE